MKANCIQMLIIKTTMLEARMKPFFCKAEGLIFILMQLLHVQIFIPQNILDILVKNAGSFFHKGVNKLHNESGVAHIGFDVC